MNLLAELKKKRAALLDKAKAIQVAAEIKNRELDDEEVSLIDQYLEEAGELDEKISAQHKRQTTLERLSQADASLDKVDRPRAVAVDEQPSGPVTTRPMWEDDPKKGFKDPKAFFMAVFRAERNPNRIPENLEYLRSPFRAAAGSDEQSTFSDPDGGFLIPEGFSPQVKSISPEGDPTAGRTFQMPMGTPSISVPARVDKNHSSSVSGGLRVYRRAEAEEATSSKQKYERISMRAHGLFGVTFETEELLSDSPISVMAMIQNGFRDEFNSKLLDEKLHGTGVGEYLGVMNSACLITVNKEVGQVADSIVGQNILNMRQRCWGYGNAIWLANHDCYVQLAQAHISGSNGDVFLFQPSRGEDVPDMLLGRPIFFTESAKTAGDLGDLLLGNWGEYMEGTYQPLQSAESLEVRFLNHERTFKIWTRNDGQPWWRSVLTPKNSALTMSPFVTLEARA